MKMTLLNKYGHWDISLVGDFDPDLWFGFAYLVTNKATGKMYIGKKQFRSVHKIRDKNTKKVKKTLIKDMDWQNYTSSSEKINTEISLGQLFDFQILSLHSCKGTLVYAEVEYQIQRNVLRSKFSDGTRLYYNGHIAGIKFIPPDEWSLESREKMRTSHLKQRMSEDNKLKLSIRNKELGIRPPLRTVPRISVPCKFCNEPILKTEKQMKEYCSQTCANISRRGKTTMAKGKPTGRKSNGSLGLKWCNNGTINKMFDENKIPPGFTKGRLI